MDRWSTEGYPSFGLGSLPTGSKVPRLTVQPVNNPCREVHIHPLYLYIRALCFRPVDMAANILSYINFTVELSCFLDYILDAKTSSI